MHRQYQVTLNGITPLIMHRDNLEHKALVDKWQRDPNNRAMSVPGDDRSPAWTWIGYLYQDGLKVALPMDAVMTACMGAGGEVKAARGRKSIKAQTQSGMVFQQPFLDFTMNGGTPILMTSVVPLLKSLDFDQHLETARSLGFDLDFRRVRVGMSKHVRVRPIFNTPWSASGVLTVTDDSLTTEILELLFSLAGDKYGMLDWRPSGRRPGPFGRFDATVTEIT